MGYIIAIVAVCLVIGGIYALTRYQKKNMEQLFNQVFESSRQVPKQKKNSFLLLMFKEAISASKKKKKNNDNMGRLNNPKYIEVQMMQMSNILKDTSKVTDKSMKRSLQLLDEYLKWEKDKLANNSKRKPLNLRYKQIVILYINDGYVIIQSPLGFKPSGDFLFGGNL